MIAPTRLASLRRLLGKSLVTLSILVITVFVIIPIPASASPSHPFPEVIPLPKGFRPEGITMGRGQTFFTGSLANGAIYRGNVRTGVGEILIQPPSGRVAVGMDFDKRTEYLFVAGGATGAGYVYDTTSGEPVVTYPFTTSEAFINGVVVTRRGAYFTNSSRPVLYYVPLSRFGDVPGQGEVKEIPLGGDFTFVSGQTNANGIDATPDGRFLIIVHSNLGVLYRVDTETGTVTRIDLGETTLPAGDGILLDGRDLYVVQNRLNQIAVVELAPDLRSGEVVRTITDPDFRVPTSIAEFGNALYAFNARFGTTPTPDTDYEVVKVPKR